MRFVLEQKLDTMSDEEMIKTDLDSMEEDDEVSLGPAALGLHRVGAKIPLKRIPLKPRQQLNARGMPIRIRKKNKLFFDEEMVNEKPMRNSPKKSPMKSPGKMLKRRKYMVGPSKSRNSGDEVEFEEQEEEDEEEISDGEIETKPEVVLHPPSVGDKQKRQRIGQRLKNLLKLPKAHKFVSHEWFYSNIDQALFCQENDFQACLRETFPQLKTRQLSRIEWSKIRRTMGKPRRCSQAFFDEERRELERKRAKIRLLQSRKIGDVTFVKDLPTEIPLPLAIGTKVTARLSDPQDGLFTGIVAAIEPSRNCYRVTFDRHGLGSLSVPDIDLMAMEGNETIPLASITQNFRKQKLLNNYVVSPLCQLSNRNDPIIGGDDIKLFKNTKVTVGGHPLKLIELIVRTKKILAMKQNKLLQLQKMNSDVAINKSYDEPIMDEDQMQYANLVVSLEKVNREVQNNLSQMQSYSKYLATEPHIASLLQPTYLREKCREMGIESMQKHNLGTVKDDNVLGLISDLGMIMWAASHLANNDQFSHVLRIIEGCIEEVKARLDDSNIDVFNKTVMVHIHHIKVGLSQELEKDDIEYEITEMVE